MEIFATPFIRTRHWAWGQLVPAISAVVIFLVLSVLLDRRPPLALHATLVPLTVQAGGSVEVTWSQDWNRLCPGKVTRRITDSIGVVHEFAPIDISLPAQVGERTIDGRMRVPAWLSDGPTIFQSVIEFRCNVLQEFWPISVVSPPLRLEVVSK